MKLYYMYIVSNKRKKNTPKLSQGKIPLLEYTGLLLHEIQHFHSSLHAPMHPGQGLPRSPLILHYY